MKNLNSNFWYDIDGEIKLNPRIRKNSLRIARDFVEFVDIKNLKIFDIIITGSIATYHWHNKSDVDLHVIFDLTNYGKHSEFIEKLLRSKKTIWNSNHHITMYKHPVEIYPQNKNEEHVASGQYSLIKNKWIIFPKQEPDAPIVDKLYVIEKYQDKVNDLLHIIGEYEMKKLSPSGTIKELKQFLERLRDSRKEGLKQNGEFSVENLVYKLLRNNGYLQKIIDLEDEIYDSALQVEINKINKLK